MVNQDFLKVAKKIKKNQLSSQEWEPKEQSKLFPFVPLTYGMGLPARRGAARAALPYPEGIKAKLFNLFKNILSIIAMVFMALIVLNSIKKDTLIPQKEIKLDLDISNQINITQGEK
jgi:hypothetical protein